MEKVSKKTKRRLTRVNPSSAVAALAVMGCGASVFGSTIASIESAYAAEATPRANLTAQSVGTPTDPAAVITAVLSVPQTLDGYTYTSWSFLTNDGTGSMDVFGKLPTPNTEPTPTVGDAISATGTYTVFDGIPEIETLTALSNVSTGNAVTAPAVVTIPQVNATALSEPPDNNGINEYLVTVDNVQIDTNGTSTQATGNFPTHATATYTLSDGVNALTMFFWASSYSVDGAMGGTPIPQGDVDITGFADYFSPNAEFVPVSITAVPEPVTLGVLSLGSLLLLKRRSRSV